MLSFRNKKQNSKNVADTTFKNPYSWWKLKSRWNVSGKKAYCLSVIMFDALIIPSKSQIFHKSIFLLVLMFTVIHFNIDDIASAWHCVSYIYISKKFSSHSLSSWLNSFIFLPALFFATAIFNLNFLARLPMTSTVFCGLTGRSFCLFYTLIQNLFQRKWW